MSHFHLRLAVFCVALSAATACEAATWVYDSKIPLAQHLDNQRFGTTVAADLYPDGSIRALYVGSPNSTVSFVAGGTFPGAGIVYALSPIGGWHITNTVHRDNPVANDHFGASLAVHHGVIVVGAPDADLGASVDAGSVTVFLDQFYNHPEINPEPAITNPIDFFSGEFAGGHFGKSVDIDGDGLTAGVGSFVAIGAPNVLTDGAVYVYHLEEQTNSLLVGLDYGSNAGSLGASVAINATSGSTFVLAAGAPGVTQAGQALAGEVYLYVPANDELTKFKTLKALNPAFADAFGGSVAIDELGHVYVGATGRQKTAGVRTGSVTLFKPSGLFNYALDIELFPSTGAANGDLCGASISLNRSGDGSGAFAIGCPSFDGLLANEGAVRVFRTASVGGSDIWFQSRLDMADYAHGADDLGRSVAFGLQHVYAGAPLADSFGATNNGTVQVFAVDQIFADGFEN